MTEIETAAPKIKAACIDCPDCGKENILGGVCDDHQVPFLLQFFSSPERATRCRYCQARFRLKDYDVEVRYKSAETLAGLDSPYLLNSLG